MAIRSTLENQSKTRIMLLHICSTSLLDKIMFLVNSWYTSCLLSLLIIVSNSIRCSYLFNNNDSIQILSALLNQFSFNDKACIL